MKAIYNSFHTNIKFFNGPHPPYNLYIVHCIAEFFTMPFFMCNNVACNLINLSKIENWHKNTLWSVMSICTCTCKHILIMSTILYTYQFSIDQSLNCITEPPNLINTSNTTSYAKSSITPHMKCFPYLQQSNEFANSLH